MAKYRVGFEVPNEYNQKGNKPEPVEVEDKSCNTCAKFDYCTLPEDCINDNFKLWKGEPVEHIVDANKMIDDLESKRQRAYKKIQEICSKHTACDNCEIDKILVKHRLKCFYENICSADIDAILAIEIK
jgi:hypothetical protein